jgi:hypothetical protein
MPRLLTFLMILALVVTQGTAMAAAVCRHETVQAHSAARASEDRTVASVALDEESAASTRSKKAPSSSDLSGGWPAPLLPPASVAAPDRTAEPVRLRPPAYSALPSVTRVPLLKPPSA